MKNVFFLILLSLGLVACNNTTTPKENNDIPDAVEQVHSFMETNTLLYDTITADGL